MFLKEIECEGVLVSCIGQGLVTGFCEYSVDVQFASNTGNFLTRTAKVSL